LLISNCDDREDAFKLVPIASFTVSDSIINVKDAVYFTDNSIYSPSSWSWDFSDGGTSTNKSPSYTYNTSGTYTVKLTVTNDYSTNTKIETKYILVQNQIPIIREEIENIGNIWIFDLRRSFDPDGEIVYLNYWIEGCDLNITTKDLSITIDFDDLACQKPFTIYIRAQDNDGDWSEVKEYAF